MCLVEVEKAPKPLPACATPVTEGMKVFTKSPKAVGAQRATMEFLLINHPLDCPICDQGGECELQDLAVGFGRDISRFSERKRVGQGQEPGSADLHRHDALHPVHALRALRRRRSPASGARHDRPRRAHGGAHLHRAARVDHELSGNIIDLCPVGALNNKPFRYHARAWEMTHGAAGRRRTMPSARNLFGARAARRLMRVVPRENEEINETWIADRDRFGFEGVYSADRAAAADAARRRRAGS